jgi:hypothetical protein
LEASRQAGIGEEDHHSEAELRRCSAGLGAVSSDGAWLRPELGFQELIDKKKERGEGEVLGLLRGGRGALIADGGRRRESWRRRAMRRLHAGASGTKVGDNSLESGWAMVGFARDERGRELGQIWPRTRKVSFFFKSLFYFYFSKCNLLF